MPNPTLHWFRLPRQLVAAVGATFPIANVLDGIWAAINSGFYYDGTVRTLGVGSAVKNIARDQPLGVTEAIYGEFATSTAVGAKWILAGRGSSPGTLPVLTEQSFLSNAVLCSITKGGGAYTSWNNATAPFSGATVMGYTAMNLTGAAAASRWWVDVYECEEGLFVVVSQWNVATAYTSGCFFLGGLIDPDPNYAEVDGRVYVQGVSGGAPFTTTNNSLAASTGFLIGPASPAIAPQGGSFVFAAQNPASRYRHTAAAGLTATADGTAVRVATNGVRVGVPIPMVIGACGTGGSVNDSSFVLGPSCAYLGRLREIVAVRDFSCGTVLRDEAQAELAHIVAGGWNAQTNSWALVH